MAFIRTVTGDIAPEALGVTDMHAHLITAPPPGVDDPDFVMPDEAAALEELQHFYMAGGRSLVEMTPRDYGRDPESLRRLSIASGVNIITVTGFIKEKFCRPLIENRTVNELADEFICDIQEGIGETGIKAGILKAGSSLNQITPLEEMVFKAVAIAHHETGALISTHTEHGTMALEQVELLTREGVDPSRMIIGHTDHKLDPNLHFALANTGVTIGYDQISKEKYAPDRDRIAMLKQMIAMGYEKQIILASDLARRSDWTAYGGGPGLTYLLWRFIPWLRKEGVSEKFLHQLLVENPRRLLAME